MGWKKLTRPQIGGYYSGWPGLRDLLKMLLDVLIVVHHWCITEKKTPAHVQSRQPRPSAPLPSRPRSQTPFARFPAFPPARHRATHAASGVRKSARLTASRPRWRRAPVRCVCALDVFGPGRLVAASWHFRSSPEASRAPYGPKKLSKSFVAFGLV